MRGAQQSDGPWNLFASSDDGPSAEDVRPPWELFAPAAAPSDEEHGDIARGFVTGLLQQDPEMVANAIEATSYLGPEFSRSTLQSGADYVREVAKTAPQEYALRAKPLFESQSLGDVADSLQQTFGLGIASIAPTLAAGLGGAAVGARGGPAGAVRGAFAGATATSAVLNGGEIYGALKAEGVDPATAAKWMVPTATAVTALDVGGLGRVVGITGARKTLLKAAIPRIAAAIKSGAITEGTTEGLQEILSQTAVSLATGENAYDVEAIVESGIGGALVGGVVGGASGAVAPGPKRDAPAPVGPQPGPWNLFGRADVQGSGTPPPPPPPGAQLSPDDRASPIPDDLIIKGEALIDAYVGKDDGVPDGPPATSAVDTSISGAEIPTGDFRPPVDTGGGEIGGTNSATTEADDLPIIPSSRIPEVTALIRGGMGFTAAVRQVAASDPPPATSEAEIPASDLRPPVDASSGEIGGTNSTTTGAEIGTSNLRPPVDTGSGEIGGTNSTTTGAEIPANDLRPPVDTSSGEIGGTNFTTTLVPPAPFNPADYVAPLSSYISTTTGPLTPTAIGAALGLPRAAATAVLDLYMSQPGSASMVRRQSGGKLGRITAPTRPNVLRYIASLGGLADSEYMAGELRARDLHRVLVPGLGALVRSTGLQIDNLMRQVRDAGYMRPENPDQPGDMDYSEFLDYLAAVKNGDDEGFGGAYAPDNIGSTTPKADAAALDRDEYQRDEHMERVRDAAAAAGIGLTPEEVTQIGEATSGGGVKDIDNAVMAYASRETDEATTEPDVDKIDAGDQFVLPGGERDERSAGAKRHADAKAELAARQQQSMMRRGGQETVGDQKGGLFGNDRDQKEIPFSIPRDADGAPLEPTPVNYTDEMDKVGNTLPNMMANTVADYVVLRNYLIDMEGMDGYEHMVIVDMATGEIVEANTIRDSGSVIGTASTTYTASTSNYVILHNHPNSSALSGPDIAHIADMPGLKWVVAVGKAGTIAAARIAQKWRDLSSAHTGGVLSRILIQSAYAQAKLKVEDEARRIDKLHNGVSLAELGLLWGDLVLYDLMHSGYIEYASNLPLMNSALYDRLVHLSPHYAKILDANNKAGKNDDRFPLAVRLTGGFQRVLGLTADDGSVNTAGAGGTGGIPGPVAGTAGSGGADKVAGEQQGGAAAAKKAAGAAKNAAVAKKPGGKAAVAGNGDEGTGAVVTKAPTAAEKKKAAAQKAGEDAASKALIAHEAKKAAMAAEKAAADKAAADKAEKAAAEKAEKAAAEKAEKAEKAAAAKAEKAAADKAAKAAADKAEKAAAAKIAAEKAEKAAAAITAVLEHELRRIGLADVAVKVVKYIKENTLAQGAYTEAVIRVAMGAKDKVWVLHHEVIHAMRDMGLFTKSEWSILQNRVRNDKKLMDAIRKRYTALSTESAREEEAIADLHADWMRGDFVPKTTLARVFARIDKFMEALSNALRGLGFKTAEDVFEAISAGQVGARVRTATPAQGVLKFADAPSMGHINGVEFPSIFVWSSLKLDNLRNLRANDLKVTAGAARDAFIEKWQDQYIQLKRAQEVIRKTTGAGRYLPEEIDAYLKEMLYHGRAGSALKRFKRDRVEPLLKLMTEKGLTTYMVDEYLSARHAKERNDAIAVINNKFPDGGSGITTDDAEQMLKNFDDVGLTPALEEAAVLVDQIINETLDLRVSSGLMTEDHAQQWRDKYEHYAPLRGLPELVDYGDERPRVGRGMDIRGQESQRATGRASRAEDVLAHVISTRQEVIVRGEKNRVLQALLKLVRDNPNPDFWQVDTPVQTAAINPETGLVEYRSDPLFTTRKNVVAVKENGVTHYITIKHPGLALALNQVGADQANSIIRTLQRFNRWLAFMYTSASPAFIAVNLVRDLITAAINLGSVEEAEGLTAQIMRGVPAALRGAFLAESKSPKAAENPMSRAYEEWAAAGGQTGMFALDDITTQRARVQDMLDDMGPGRLLSVKRAAVAIEEAIITANTAVESGVRLATFVALRARGVSIERAAAISKDLTVNFNRRGQWTRNSAALYLFFNAGVQGPARIFEAVTHPKVRKVMAGIVVSSALLAIVNGMLSPEDDDGESAYDKIPAYVKEHNLIIMNPLTKANGEGAIALKIPLPYGYNVLTVIGTAVGDQVLSAMGIGKRHDPWEQAADVAVSSVNAFNPMGGASDLVSALIPDALRPVYEIEANKNFMGNKIMPEQSQFDVDKPDSELAWKSTNPVFKWFSREMNSLTGGDEVYAGAVDVSPETLEHVLNFFTGSAGIFVADTVDVVYKMLSGQSEELAWRDIPIAKRFVESPNMFHLKDHYYDLKDNAEITAKRLELMKMKGNAPMVGYITQEFRPELALAAELTGTKDKPGIESRLRKISREIRKVEGSAALSDDEREVALDVLSGQQRTLMSSAVATYNAAQDAL